MPYDNAMAESFFATLKLEIRDGKPFASREAARMAVFEYVEVFYACILRWATDHRRRRSGSIYKADLHPDDLPVELGSVQTDPFWPCVIRNGLA